MYIEGVVYPHTGHSMPIGGFLKVCVRFRNGDFGCSLASGQGFNWSRPEAHNYIVAYVIGFDAPLPQLNKAKEFTCPECGSIHALPALCAWEPFVTRKWTCPCSHELWLYNGAATA